jgi:hypothetical protein
MAVSTVKRKNDRAVEDRQKNEWAFGTCGNNPVSPWGLWGFGY